MERPVDNLLTAISSQEGCSIHFVDIENLAGSGFLTSEAVIETCYKYVQSTNASKKDLFCIAAGPQNKVAAFNGWVWGNTFYQFRKGKDGADNALVSFFEGIENPEKFERVFVASGDHSLATIAEKAEFRGIPVTVVTGKGAKSRLFSRFQTLSIGGF